MVVNKHNTARVASCLFIIYCRCIFVRDNTLSGTETLALMLTNFGGIAANKRVCQTVVTSKDTE